MTQPWQNEKKAIDDEDVPVQTKTAQINPDGILWPEVFGRPKRRGKFTKKGEKQDLEEKQRLELEEQTEQEDLRQLTELYDAQDAGEKVDEERIYELDLFDRFRREAYLLARKRVI